MSIVERQSSIALSLPSQLGYEVVARDAVAAFARRQGFPSERIEDVKTALCEACINAIEHGNLLSPHLRVEVRCHADDQRLLIEICDGGLKRYEPNGRPLTIAEKVGSGGRLRGMGLLLIAELADEAGFDLQNRNGNCFRLAIYRKSPAI